MEFGKENDCFQGIYEAMSMTDAPLSPDDFSTFPNQGVQHLGEECVNHRHSLGPLWRVTGVGTSLLQQDHSQVKGAGGEGLGPPLGQANLQVGGHDEDRGGNDKQEGDGQDGDADHIICGDDPRCCQSCGEKSTARLAGEAVKGLTFGENIFQMLIFCQNTDNFPSWVIQT
ncbi:uncharacterized protein LOC144293423 [Canis aureus]